MGEKRDRLFRKTAEPPMDFEFNDQVADVFDDMLHRSVPFYDEIQRMVVEVGLFHLVNGGVLYDVGSSLGTTIEGFTRHITNDDLGTRYVGFEPSLPMRQRASKKLQSHLQLGRVSFIGEPIEAQESLPEAQVIIFLFTLQFVRPIHRSRIIKMCYESLRENGCILIAEKTLSDDPVIGRRMIDFYHDFKSRNGYSSIEISKKREMLENVLVPFRNSENIELLREAGFTVIENIFRWYNFSVYYAVKRKENKTP